MIDLVDRVIVERPAFHRAETEIRRAFSADETSLDAAQVAVLSQGDPQCYGIGPKAARFFFDHVQPEMSTLEVGSGISTLMFAMKGSRHTCVTPNGEESQAICSYAESHGIDTSKVTFVCQPSTQYLPTCTLQDLDLVFIDGKHAFPWPIVDWFYTADRLRKGGLMVIDDTHLYPLQILGEFMREDARWAEQPSPDDKTLVFQKLAESVHDVAWHMQASVVKRLPKETLLTIFARRVKRRLSG